MAKRFMDNTIFDKSWYRKLPVRLKIVWFYLINKCNHAGIWECDIDLLSFQIVDFNEPYTLEEILKAFGDNIIDIGDNKYYLSKFISFQYGIPLNPNVKVHQSVIKLLSKYDENWANSLVRVIDKDIIRDKDKDIKERAKCFAKRVEKEVLGMQIDPKDFGDFISYWTEHNDGGKVLRYEKQDIFNVRRRMTTWTKNSKKFNMKFQPTEEDLERKEVKIENEYQDQRKRLREADNNIASDEDR